MLFAVVFIKNPIYVLGFFMFFLLFLITILLDKGFYGFFYFFSWSYFWCWLSLIEYIANEKTNTNLMGYDLKKIVSVSRVFLGVIFLILFLGWLLTMEYQGAGDLMTVLWFTMFTSGFCFIIGTFLARAMILVGVSKKIDGNISIDSQRLVKDIIYLLAQK